MKEVLDLAGCICTCGGIWFNLLLPESDPSYCPFCNKRLEVEDRSNLLDGEFEEDDLDYHTEALDGNRELMNGKVDSLTVKLCDFCMNEIFFSKDDAGKAKYCPYCDNGRLLDSPDELNNNEAPDAELTELINNLTDAVKKQCSVSELKDVIVNLKLEGVRKPVMVYCNGVDGDNKFMKVLNQKGITEWIPLDSIELISVITTDDEVKEDSKD